jgi:hypothetical protein
MFSCQNTQYAEDLGSTSQPATLATDKGPVRPVHPAIDWATEGTDWRGRVVAVICPDCGEGSGQIVSGVLQRLRQGTFTGRCSACGNARKGPATPSEYRQRITAAVAGFLADAPTRERRARWKVRR